MNDLQMSDLVYRPTNVDSDLPMNDLVYRPTDVEYFSVNWSPTVLLKKLSDKATLPTYAHEGDAGMDLQAVDDVVIPCGETVKVPTDIAMVIPNGYVGLIYARSGLATKQGLAPANKVGVVDSSYRGNVIVALHNHGQVPQIIKAGDRIAQMVITPFVSCHLIEVEELDETDRSTGGFGSSGK